MSTRTLKTFFQFFSTFLFIYHATATTLPSDIHDLLPDYGFPKGILPNNIASYTLSPSGYFTLHLQSPCYVRFSGQLVYYDTLVTGTLTYGSVSGVSGIQAKMLFIWLPVTGMEVDSPSGMLQFFVGALSKKLPANQFQDVPGCSSKACKDSATKYFVDLIV
ncbi:hypothetical protein MtrunA17_Chr8g0378501 [Medicago truncatula]|uniref:DUF538 family protein n=1 Tax=Medicago truncatula TaxID=3880 RepID=G7LHY3_MEDTR|nr:uncharacterized protein LOC11411259 [Medicago truncatula]AET04177.1 DUF538 family protein [Medicago truncatula]RHN42588.1 hypothetical protein MtrunA17_Chr8g0378501 [Medicago truncatula]